jgi:hypothetical protein
MFYDFIQLQKKPVVSYVRTQQQSVYTGNRQIISKRNELKQLRYVKTWEAAYRTLRQRKTIIT